MTPQPKDINKTRYHARLVVLDTMTKVSETRRSQELSDIEPDGKLTTYRGAVWSIQKKILHCKSLADCNIWEFMKMKEVVFSSSCSVPINVSLDRLKYNSFNNAKVLAFKIR